MATLYELTGGFLELLQLAEQGEIDTQTIRDTLESLGYEIEEKADGYAKVIAELTGQVNTLKTEEDRLSTKRKSIENNIDRMKRSLEEAMKATGKTKFKTDLFSFNIQRNAPRLIITGDVPKEYLIPQPPKVDNKKIRDLLKKEELKFAHLEQGESLRIR